MGTRDPSRQPRRGDGTFASEARFSRCLLRKSPAKQIQPELAREFGVTVVNRPGTIDGGYRGEVGVILINHGQKSVRVERGMRIGQLAVRTTLETEVVEGGSLRKSRRGAGGFGSTDG